MKGFEIPTADMIAVVVNKAVGNVKRGEGAMILLGQASGTDRLLRIGQANTGMRKSRPIMVVARASRWETAAALVHAAPCLRAELGDTISSQVPLDELHNYLTHLIGLALAKYTKDHAATPGHNHTGPLPTHPWCSTARAGQARKEPRHARG